MSVSDVLTGPVAMITVGESGQVFTIHKELLCRTSTYFEAALDNDFLETSTQAITLDDDPVAFRSYATWLYVWELDEKTFPEQDYERHLLSLYLFADKRGIRLLSNDVITMLASYWVTNNVMENELAKEFLPIIPRNYSLYDLFLDNQVLFLRCDGLGDEFNHYPAEVLLEIMKRDCGYDPRFKHYHLCLWSICYYHEHKDDTEEASQCAKRVEEGRNIHPEHNDRGDLKQSEWKWS